MRGRGLLAGDGGARGDPSPPSPLPSGVLGFGGPVGGGEAGAMSTEVPAALPTWYPPPPQEPSPPTCRRTRARLRLTASLRGAGVRRTRAGGPGSSGTACGLGASPTPRPDCRRVSGARALAGGRLAPHQKKTQWCAFARGEKQRGARQEAPGGTRRQQETQVRGRRRGGKNIAQHSFEAGAAARRRRTALGASMIPQAGSRRRTHGAAVSLTARRACPRARAMRRPRRRRRRRRRRARRLPRPPRRRRRAARTGR
jgi:hypothetical protein